MGVKKIVFCIILLISSHSWARLQLGLDIGYLQDGNTIASTNTTTNSFIDGRVLVRLGPYTNFNLALDYVYLTISQKESSTTTSTLTSTSPMAGLQYGFGKDNLVALLLAWGPSTQANYQVSGSTADLWSGTSYMGKISLQPEIGKNTYLTASITYFSSTYTSKSSNSGSSNVSEFTRTYLAPTIGLMFKF